MGRGLAGGLQLVFHHAVHVGAVVAKLTRLTEKLRLVAQ